jgi:hypothetical protein
VSARAPGSRESAEAAGWDGGGQPRQAAAARPGRWDEWLGERERPKWDSFSWLTVRALFESVNDFFAKFRPEIVDERRARWIAAQRERLLAGDGDFVIAPPAPVRGAANERAFLLVGDTGEQDASQYAVAPYLTGDDVGSCLEQRAPEFLVIVSDVIYPAGDVNEYVNGFYIPYRRFEKPIYALPGNHDWYDGLDGFMYHFCGAEPLPLESFRSTEIRPATRLANLLWRRSARPERERLSKWRDSRPWARDETKAVQPAPYFALDLGDLMLVNIDTGVTGAIDDEQGRWLLRVSERPKQKILLTGKPIYVDGAYHPGPINWKRSRREAAGDPPPFATVDDVVRHEQFGYVAAIGGDVHNYQRYPIWLEEQKRRIYYLVSGGGGAYLSTTHRIGPLGDEPLGEAEWPDGLRMPVDEDVPPSPPPAAGESEADEIVASDDVGEVFHCYPQRGDSLAYTARRAGPRMLNAVQSIAAAFVAAAALLLYADPLGEAGGLALATAYVPLVMAAVLFLALGKRLELQERLGLRLGAQPAEPWRQGPVRYAFAAVVFISVLLIALAAYAADRAYGGDLLTSGRFWGTAAVALAVPAGLIGAILLSHDLRGSTPASLPLLAVTASFVAVLPILFPFSEFLEAPAWFVTVVYVAASMMVGTALLGALAAYGRSRDGERVGFGRWLCNVLYDVLAFSGPMLLVYALWQRTDADNVPWLAPALVWCGTWPLLVGWLAGTQEPTRLKGAARFLDEVGAASRFLATVAWITAAAILLHSIGDGWIATATIGAVATLAILVALATMLLLAIGTAMKRFGLAIALALTVLALPLVSLSGALDGLAFAGAAMGLLIVAYLNVKALRRGKLNADAAQTRIRQLLNEGRENHAGRGPRHRTPMPKEDEPLFNLLYPFRWAKRERAQGTEQTGALAQTIARLLAELGDSDEPPFFKNLLRIDLRELPGQKGDADRELRIRCLGVTGFAQEEERGAPIEDEIAIPFLSAEAFATRSPR